MPPNENSKEKKKETPRTFQSVKGMHDVLPSDEPYWEKIEGTTKAIAKAHGFGRIEPPVLEFAELYNKTSGDESDVVQKEMYTLKTKGGDVLALRPEYTPGIARAYMQNGLSRAAQPQKLVAMGPIFRHERPQLGRARQFTQIDLEVLGGTSDPMYDAEVIAMFYQLLVEIKIKNPTVKLNSIGDRVCRPVYKKQLIAYYKAHEDELCEDCKRRLETNPLRLLDCKEPKCEALKENAPSFLDKLCAPCSNHFKEVLEYLDEIKIPYSLDPHLVRGLDYYSRTVFEMYAEGAEEEIGALAAGGRYDYLMETIGGHVTPAVGGASGVERLIAVMRAREVAAAEGAERGHRGGNGSSGNGGKAAANSKKVFLAHAGDLAKKKSFVLLQSLREKGILVAEALSKESLSAQLKVANKEGITIALILGQKEIYENSVIIRDLTNGVQEAVSLDKLVDELKRRLSAK
jgi:histidyl-tRNA synthetase